MFQKINKIYKALEDDESRDIFVYLLLYSITNDMEQINKIVKKYSPWMGALCSQEKVNNLIKFLENSIKKKKKIIIYGAGKVGQIIKSMLRNVEIECFSDMNSDLQASNVDGTPVISPEKLVSQYNKNTVIVLAVWRRYHKTLIELFARNGVAEEDIINGLDYFNFKGIYDNIYYEPNLINYVNNEIFVDAGSFDFNSSIRLAQRCKTLKKIYAFEPDKINYKLCQKRVSDFTECEVKLYEAGLWNYNSVLGFNSYGGDGSRIVSSGNDRITVVPLDEVIDEDGATFIKMDIEGAELEALKGATKTIKRFKPKLAISVYHKPEDIIDIPEYLIDLNQGYKFFIRHYTNWTVDTILYAL